MGDLNITSLKPEIAMKRDFTGFDITEKKDGCLIYYRNGELFSTRTNRSSRFKHILKILKDNNCPNLMGEIFYGKNVFDISKSENWDKAQYYLIDIDNKELSYPQRQILLKQLVKEISNPFIIPLKKFNTFKESWDYTKLNETEGVVIRDSHNWFKVKLKKEVKEEIVSHEVGSVKGVFVLKSGNRVSGTSVDYVKRFYEIKASGKIPIMEVEYQFLTNTKHYFQPICRRIYAEGEENGE
jgi:hypothetical protein